MITKLIRRRLNPPEVQTVEQYRIWVEECRKDHRFLIWVYFDLANIMFKYKKNLYRSITAIKTAILSRTNSYMVKTDLNRWVVSTSCDRILYSNFKILQEFYNSKSAEIEESILNAHINYVMGGRDDERSRMYKEVKRLLSWWEVARPARRLPNKPLDVNCDNLFFQNCDECKVYSRKVKRLKTKWLTEDQEMLERLIKIRPMLVVS